MSGRAWGGIGDRCHGHAPCKARERRSGVQLRATLTVDVSGGGYKRHRVWNADVTALMEKVWRGVRGGHAGVGGRGA